MRIAAVSDLHGNLPDIPPCDILIIAGDICTDRLPGGQWARHAPAVQAEWLDRYFRPWLNDQRSKFKRGFGCWGNHDFIGPTEGSTGIVIPGFEIVTDEERTIDGLRFWFSPWTSQNDLRMRWAFMAEDSELVRRFDPIPPGVDIIVSHSPAYGYGDDPGVPLLTNGGDVHLGSKSLRDAVYRVRPRVLICGHIHGGYGQYRMTLDDGSGMDPNEHTVDIYNVALVNEGYKPVHPVTIIDL